MTPEEERRLREAMARMQAQGLDPSALPITMESQVQSITSQQMAPGMVSAYIDQAERAKQNDARSRSVAGKEAGIKSMRGLAKELRGARAQGRTVGPYNVYVAPNWGDVFSEGAQRLAGGWLAGEANKADIELDQERALIKAAQQEREDAIADRDYGLRLRSANLADDRFDAEKGRWEVEDDQWKREMNQRITEFNKEYGLDLDTFDREGDEYDEKRAYITIVRPSDMETSVIRQGDTMPAGFMSVDDYKTLQDADDAKKAGGYTEGKTKDEREKFSYGAGKYLETVRLLDTYKDEYSANPAVRAVPGGATIDNMMNRVLPDGVLGSDSEAALWWSDAKKRELKPRHDLFGSAFTKPEQAAYSATTFDYDDDPAFIRQQLQRRAELEKKATERMAAEYLMKGYDPEQVMLNFGDAIDIPKLQADIESGEFQKRVAAEQEEARAQYDKALEDNAEWAIKYRDGKTEGQKETTESTGDAIAQEAATTQAETDDPAPPGVDPEDWKYLDEEQRKLFRR